MSVYTCFAFLARKNMYLIILTQVLTKVSFLYFFTKCVKMFSYTFVVVVVVVSIDSFVGKRFLVFDVEAGFMLLLRDTRDD